MQTRHPNIEANPASHTHDAGALRASLGLAVLTLLGAGLAYSLLGTGLGQLAFPQQASGSLLERDGKVIGSAWVSQPFADDRYFQSRPSASSYDPMAAAGSNQARSNPALQQRIAEATATVMQREGIAASTVPADMVTQSGGGMDPHTSPAAAQVQVARVAKARGLSPAQVQALVERHTESPQWGVLGQPRINVLALNLALDANP